MHDGSALFPAVGPPGLLGPGAPPLTRAHDGFSSDGSHRFSLDYWWAGGVPLIVIGQNPSKATRSRADATVTRCARRAFRMGLAGLLMRNLFSYVATHPADLWRAGLGNADAGAHNLAAIRDTLAAFPGAPVLFAPGGDPHPAHRARAAEVEGMVRAMGRDLMCLGTTAAGLPRHPSRLGYDAEMVAWAGTFAREGASG